MIRLYGFGKSSVGKMRLGRAILKKMLVIGGAAAFAVILGTSGYILTQDLSRYLPELDERISSQIGQHVTVNGPVRVAVGFDDAVWLSLEDVSIQPKTVKADATAYSATLEKVRIQIALLPLLRREILTEVLEISGGKFLAGKAMSVEKTSSQLPREVEAKSSGFPGGGWTIVEFRRLLINRSFVGVVDQGREVFTFPISNFSAEPGEVGLALSLRGKIEGRDVVFEGTSGPWEALLEGRRIFLGGTMKSESAYLAINGSIGDPTIHGIELLARGGAENLGDVAVLAGLGNLERTTAMSIAVHVKATADSLAIRDLDLKFGRGDLSGWFTASRGERIEIEGDLKSDFLDLEAFEGGHLLHPPERIFPETPLPFDFIRKLDGEIRLNASTILLANARLVDGNISMIASDGVLAINPIAVTFEDGLLDGSLVLYARDTPGFKASASLTNFDLGRFLTAAKVTEPFEAHMHFGVRLAGEGNSIAAMFANANGEADLVMGEGRLGAEIASLFGGRSAAGLTPVEAKASGEDVIDLKCLVSRFDVAGGVARSGAFLVQTDDSMTTGKGSINFKTETIDLRLAPRPKNPAYLDAAADLRVTGSFVAPRFHVDRKNISKGIAGSLGRFATARRDKADLLPLIDRAVTSNNSCIVALTGQKVIPKGRSRVYSLTQAQ